MQNATKILPKLFPNWIEKWWVWGWNNIGPGQLGDSWRGSTWNLLSPSWLAWTWTQMIYKTMRWTDECGVLYRTKNSGISKFCFMSKTLSLKLFLSSSFLWLLLWKVAWNSNWGAMAWSEKSEGLAWISAMEAAELAACSTITGTWRPRPLIGNFSNNMFVIHIFF